MKMKYILPAVISVFFAKSIYADQQVFDLPSHGILTAPSPVKSIEMEQVRGKICTFQASTTLKDDEILYQDWAAVQKTFRDMPEVPFAKAILATTGFATPLVFGELATTVLLASTLDGAITALETQALTAVTARAFGLIPSIPTVGFEEVVKTKTASPGLGKAAGRFLNTAFDNFKTRASAIFAKKSIKDDAETQPTIARKVKAFWGKTKETIKTGIRSAVRKVAPFYVKVKNWFV
jgi:hypothetical protein